MLPGSSASENDSTRWRDARASSAGFIHSHRPWMPGTTTMALFAQDTDYIGEPHQRTMLNLRVDDLPSLMAKLRARGVEVLPETEDSEFGRFGWCVDPEGNRIELWEPAEGM